MKELRLSIQMVVRKMQKRKLREEGGKTRFTTTCTFP